MSAGLLERVPVGLINDRARHAKPGHVAQTIAGSLLFGVGWLVAKAFRVLWLTLAWAFAACQVGWQQAMGADMLLPPARELAVEVERLRAEVKRLGG